MIEAYQNSLPNENCIKNPKEGCVTADFGISSDANEHVKEVNRHTSKEVTCEPKPHCTGLSKLVSIPYRVGVASYRACICR
jgi:hypothetical protein